MWSHVESPNPWNGSSATTEDSGVLIKVEQAIFTSVRSRRHQGYHLVAQSPGFESSLVPVLSTWGPSHGSLLDDQPTAESINFAPLTPDWCAVSRTTYGGPEYSGRGGLQVFTRFILMRRDQLAGYENNALALIRTAMTLGFLRLHVAPPEQLEAIELPDHALADVVEQTEAAHVPIDDVMRILRFQNRVAILGLRNPYPTLAQIIQGTPREERLHLSFTTGLKPSVHRDFRLHFVTSADMQLHGQLTSQGIDLVTAS